MTLDCVFCLILDGATPASVVYEDESTIAFLNRRQLHPGHVLVIPHEHHPDVRSFDDALALAVLRTVRLVSRAVSDSLRPDGLTVWHSVGAAAGQEIPHAHFHVQPRYHGDGLHRVYRQLPDPKPCAELDEIAATIRTQLPDHNGI